MSDVLELLLGLANGVHDDLDVAAEAVNEIIDLEQEITRLRAENEDLRAALKLLRDIVWRYDSTQGGMRMNEDGEYVRWDVVDEICRQVMPGEER